MLFWCRNMKPTDYRGRSASFTAVNNLSRQNRIFDAVLSVSFWDVDYFMWKQYLSKTPSKTKNNHCLRLKVKHLPMHPNQQDDPDCEINSMVPNITFSRRNHMLDWLVTILLSCINLKPKEVGPPPSHNSITCWNETGPLMLDVYLCLIF